jgi:aspartyl-tRNA(Asn)/glutamyl-tRNA(Gln) amidotransferase subunit A
MAGAFVRAADYVNATRLRRKMTDAFHAMFADIDVAITSSSMDPACRIDDPVACETTYARQSRSPFNVTGSPALSMPVGFTKTGLPLAMQIVARPFDEATIYRVAEAYERATDWSTRHPELG